ncbi:MAG: glycosyltransferase [Mucilaginibacter sp.]|uniref:glycosyltransferase family 4 protein n=1 Tax=Mucilaginibacter sp. TaxID=1882438 RepID=UPI0031B49265
MKILFIIPEYIPHSGGGISTYYQHYIKAIKPHCERIKVIVGSGYIQDTTKFNHEGIEVEYLEPVLFKEYLQRFTKFDFLPEYRNNIAAAWAMWQQADSGNEFDIIECTDFGLGFIPWVIHHNKPVMTRLHGSSGQITMNEDITQEGLMSDFFRQTEMLLLPFCDYLITYSLSNQLFWNNILNNKKVHYIPPVYSHIEKHIVSFSERDNNGLLTARVQKWKGAIELCKAMQLLKNNISVKWIGRDTVYNDKLNTIGFLSAEFPNVWNKYIIHNEAKPNDEIKQLQRKAKFGLVSSTWDMFNFTCIEFMASGTPIICSDGAGAVDLIEDNKNGFKYSANKIDKLAECIDLVNNLSQSDYEKIALAGIHTVDTLLSAEKLIPINLEYYDKVIKQFVPSSSNTYTNSIYKPTDVKYLISNLLDTQPIKRLIKYLVKRIINKIKAV